MPAWDGVRPGTHQNRVMDWFSDNIEGNSSDIANLLYQEDSVPHRNRANSVLWALEKKGLLQYTDDTDRGRLPGLPGRWSLKSVPLSLRPSILEQRIRVLEDRIQTLEQSVQGT